MARDTSGSITPQYDELNNKLVNIRIKIYLQEIFL